MFCVRDARHVHSVECMLRGELGAYCAGYLILIAEERPTYDTTTYKFKSNMIFHSLCTHKKLKVEHPNTKR